jgi:hypothetical protein
MAAQIGLETVSATIQSGQSLSAAVSLGAGRIRGILLPSVWTAAVLTFQISLDGTNFAELIDDRPTIGYATASGYAVAASQFLCIDPVLFEGVAVIKIRSGTSSVPVNQGQLTTLTISTRL